MPELRELSCSNQVLALLIPMSFNFAYSRFLRYVGKRSKPYPGLNKYELIAISPDTRFLASVLFKAGAYGWTVRWARSIDAAAVLSGGRFVPVVIYDCCLATDDWSESIARLKLAFADSCLIMAARFVSEELWQKALARGVYDVVSRSDNGDHLAVTVRFACDWRAARPLASTRLS
jgi:hypothetical protein